MTFRSLDVRLRFVASRLHLVLALSTIFVLASNVEAHRGHLRSTLAPAAAPAASEPQPPCGRDAVPAYPGLGDPPVVKSWNKSDFDHDWKPSACTHWSEEGFTSLVTITARFQVLSGAEGLLQHIGAISQLAGAQYWSTTHKQWRTLITDAYALASSQPDQRRMDFTVDELKPGKPFYFEQVDNLSGKTIYRMNILEASSDRIVIEVENVGTMRYHFIPVFHPAELQSIYFFDRESDKIWRYYSILREGKNASRLVAGNEASSVNRAVAFYRHMVGIPSNQEPPAAR